MKGDISLQLPSGSLLFTGYDDDQISINQKPYRSGLSINNNAVSAPWGPDRFRQLTTDHLAPLLESTPEVVIIGTGYQTLFPSDEIVSLVADHQIGLECMDSRSAARTYNILVSEGRTVAAALMLPGTRG